MALQMIHTFLVHPNRGGAPAQPGGTTVALEGELYKMLNDVYLKSVTECDIEIAFNAAPDGTQSNACRDLVITHLRQQNIDTARALASRLASVTTNRSGLGLMFLLIGTENGRYRMVLSRFPAQSAISAEENQNVLSVAFLEKVFMKSQYSYKAAVYEHASLNAGFWTGKVIDKQIASKDTETTHYWVKDFLDSDFQTTDALGTRRLAKALKEAVRKAPDLETKQAIAAAVTLAGAVNGEVMSATDFMTRFAMPLAARDLIVSEMPNGIAGQVFRFDSDEFAIQVPYRSMELNTGAILTAPAEEFDGLFQKQIVDPEEQRMRITTEGRVITERIEKR